MLKPKMAHKKEVRRSVGRWAWNLLSWLPLFLRGPIIRRMFVIESDLPENLVFKRAETYEELEQAFEVAYEAYRERDLVLDSEVRMRITKYHALPTTTIMIAKLDNQVVATISVIRDSALGLPLEKLFNIDFLRQDSKVIAEVSTLAIKRGHRSQRGKLLLALCNYMNRYCIEQMGVDTLVVAVHPEVSDFYRCVLMFQDIEDGVTKHYDFVKGAAASAHYLKIQGPAQKAFEKAFRTAPDQRNVFKFFYQMNISNFIFPEKRFYSSSEFTFSPEWLRDFFQERIQILQGLSDEEKLALGNIYFYPEYRELFGVKEKLKRTEARFAAHCPMQLQFLNEGGQFQGKTIEVSRVGMKIRLDENLPGSSHPEVIIRIDISPDRQIQMLGQVIWRDEKEKNLGVWFNHFIPQPWHEFVDHLEQNLIAMAHSSVQANKIKKARGS